MSDNREEFHVLSSAETCLNIVYFTKMRAGYAKVVEMSDRVLTLMEALEKEKMGRDAWGLTRLYVYDAIHYLRNSPGVGCGPDIKILRKGIDDIPRSSIYPRAMVRMFLEAIMADMDTISKAGKYEYKQLKAIFQAIRTFDRTVGAKRSLDWD